MELPQIIYITLTSIGLLTAARNHGKPRDNSNFWYTFTGSVIGYTLLIWGGFFS